MDEKEDILYDNKSGYRFTPEQFEQLKEELKKTHKIDYNKKQKNRKRSKENKKGKNSENKEKVDRNDTDMGVKRKVLNLVKQGGKNKSQTLKKINEALEKAEEKNLDKISLTDPDAHWRPNKQHYFQLVHNLQIIGDTDSRFIIDNKVVDAATDMNQLIPLMDDLQLDISDLNENTILNADNGYFSGDNLKYIEEQKFDGL